MLLRLMIGVRFFCFFFSFLLWGHICNKINMLLNKTHMRSAKVNCSIKQKQFTFLKAYCVRISRRQHDCIHWCKFCKQLMQTRVSFENNIIFYLKYPRLA